MTAQRFYLPVTGTVNAAGSVVLRFPSVPQGSIWTGSLSLYAPPQLTGGLPAPAPPFNLSNGPLAGSMWFVKRNESPVVQMGGAATVHDVQLVAQEVLSVTGYGLTSGDTITAVWAGYSEDADAAAIVYPMISGSSEPYTYVYNGAGPNSPLDVVTVPDPSRTVAVAADILSVGSGTTTLIPASSQGRIQLHSAYLSVATGYSGTTVESIGFLGALQLNDSVTQVPLMRLETILIQTSSQAVAASLDLHALPVLSTQAVELISSAFAGSGSVRVNGSVVYSYVPLAP